MTRYAFIDVPNTNGTTQQCLGFEIDYERLYRFLTNENWDCDKIFYYKGHKSDRHAEQMQKKLGQEIGYEVRTKQTHIHPNEEKSVAVVCQLCQHPFIHKMIIDGNRKSNCDVELTVDALNTCQPGDDALIFTADGDFTYLIKDLMEKGVTVAIVSSTERSGSGKKRFSTRLRDLLSIEGEQSIRLRFLDINRWKESIEKLKTASPSRE